MRMVRRLFVLVALCFTSAWAAGADTVFAANSTIPGAVTSYSTIQSAGFEWRITGDDNANCVVTMEYRNQGTTVWKNAQPLLRVETGLWHHGEDPGNLLAGSLFFLAPATTYDVRLTLGDPDGGASQQIVSVTTHSEPRADPTGRVRYILPGNGGGSGTQSDPFRGLAAADAAAQPGDVFIVQPGTYTVKFMPKSNGTAGHPIVYFGADRAGVVLDGNGGLDSLASCVDFRERQYLFLENVTLQNCLRPVMVDRTTGVVIRGCTIEPVHQLLNTVGVHGDSVRDLFVADNTIQMPGDWEHIGRTGSYGTGGYGVEVTGDGIILCYNHVIESWDALDVGDGDGTGLRTFNVDVYGNDVDRASDDGCQTDAVHQNIRVFRNRFVNTGSPWSCQPSFGGPCYLLYNELCNTRIDPFKYHQETGYFGAADPQETSGMIAFHNTNLSSKSGWYESGYWHHVQHRNNLLLGARANLYSLYVSFGWRGDLDYDGYNRQQLNLANYNHGVYTSLPTLALGAGQEAHGIEVGLDAFVRAIWPPHPEWDWPQGYGAPFTAATCDLQLAAGSIAVDRGQVLPNINDNFVGSAPDLGCYERGQPPPAYGPRALVSVGVPPLRSPGVSGLRVLAPRPNPARGAVAFTLLADRPLRASVRVVDIAGRTIRSFGEGREFASGTHTLTWDGRDAANQRMPSGVYAIEVRSGGAIWTRKVTLLR